MALTISDFYPQTGGFLIGKLELEILRANVRFKRG